MVSEDKVKLMTSIAILEKRKGKKAFSVNRYFRGDYVSKHMIRGFVIYTLAALFCMLLWLICNMEILVDSLNVDGMVSLGKSVGGWYLIGLILYLFVSYWVYYRRYDDAAGNLKIYTAKLKKLDKRYEFQDKTKKLAREGHKL